MCVLKSLINVFSILCPQSRAQNQSNVVEIKGLEADVSYCFYVAAYITSRKPPHQMGDWTPVPVCWPPKQLPFWEGRYLEAYSFNDD